MSVKALQITVFHGRKLCGMGLFITSVHNRTDYLMGRAETVLGIVAHLPSFWSEGFHWAS